MIYLFSNQTSSSQQQQQQQSTSSSKAPFKRAAAAEARAKRKRHEALTLYKYGTDQTHTHRVCLVISRAPLMVGKLRRRKAEESKKRMAAQLRMVAIMGAKAKRELTFLAP